jgi:hypothetical protein
MSGKKLSPEDEAFVRLWEDVCGKRVPPMLLSHAAAQCSVPQYRARKLAEKHGLPTVVISIRESRRALYEDIAARWLENMARPVETKLSKSQFCRETGCKWDMLTQVIDMFGLPHDTSDVKRCRLHQHHAARRSPRVEVLRQELEAMRDGLRARRPLVFFGRKHGVSNTMLYRVAREVGVETGYGFGEGTSPRKDYSGFEQAYRDMEAGRRPRTTKRALGAEFGLTPPMVHYILNTRGLR